ncbi:MAG: DUF1360 domain-containing protein [Hymenobacter sp.]|nr:MAG: DUF1360 domain-containing protein [Hymenobacter sp.]
MRSWASTTRRISGATSASTWGKVRRLFGKTVSCPRCGRVWATRPVGMGRTFVPVNLP